jgi:hypothetical protein
MTVLSAARFPGAEKEPLGYPGSRPNFSYVYHQQKVYKLLPRGDTYADLWVDGPTGQTSLDDFLIAHGNAPLEERQAVLAVGSNGCPGRLAEKYGHQPDVALPVFVGTLADTAVVYSRQLAPYGALPATYLSQRGSVSWLSVNMLTKEQVAHMDGTEGIGWFYERIPVPGHFRVEGGPKIGNLSAYLDRKILAYQGKPVLLRIFARESPDWPTMDESEVLSLVFDQAGLLLGESVEMRHQQILKDESLRLQLTEFVDAHMSELTVDRRGGLADLHP